MPPVTLHDRLLAGLSRRELLRLAAWLGAAAVLPPFPPRRAQAQQQFVDYPFSLGVASGDPLPDGVVLWTRLAPRPLESAGGMPPAAIELGWEVARDRLFRVIEQKGTATASPDLAHSVHVEVTGLEPAREYFYRFRAGGEISPTGRTRTAPAAGAAVDSLRFAVCGCSYYEDGYFTAYRRIGEERLRLRAAHRRLHLRGRGRRRQAQSKVREHLVDEVFSLADYRLRYAQYKMDDDLRAAHAVGAVLDELGRPRGGQQLRRRVSTGEHAARGVLAAPRRGLPGVLRAHAAAARRRSRVAAACGSTGGFSSARWWT